MLDTLIVGAGPAGLTALLYSYLYGLDAVCIGDVFGGKAMLAPGIVDYPGVAKIDGKEFIERLFAQMSEAKTQVLKDRVTLIQPNNGFKVQPDQEIFPKQGQVILPVVMAESNQSILLKRLLNS